MHGVFRSLAVLAGTTILCMPAASQGVGSWKNFTAQNSVRSIGVSNGEVWAATSGGVFEYGLSDSLFRQYTNSEGLPGNDVTSIAVDENGGVWTGDANGGLAFYQPGTSQWNTILNISQSSFTNKKINELISLGDTLLVAADYGISLLRKQALEFRDSYVQLGNFPAQSRVRGIAIGSGYLWAATDYGVAAGALSSPNLIAPSAWKTYTIADGLPSDSVMTVFVYNGVVYAGTNLGLAYFNGTSWAAAGSAGPIYVKRSVVGTSSAYIITHTGIFEVQSPDQIVQTGIFPTDELTDIAFSATMIVVGTDARGIGIVGGNALTYRVPNGPASNLFISLAMDQRGVLWAATGRDGRGQGFYSFDGTSWKNYNTRTDTAIKTNDYHRVAVGANDTKWVCSWGFGVMMIGDDGVLHNFTPKNAPFSGFTGDPNFAVICDAAADWNGNTWIVNWDPADGKPLWEYKSDSTWQGFQNAYILNLSPVSGITIDQYSNKWLYQRITGNTSPGLYFVDSRGTPTDPSDDLWDLITASSGLVDNSVNAVTVDNDGAVWVGTNAGANVIINPLDPTTALANSIVIPVAGIFVNTIAVDPLNNKWIGTKNGVFVLSDRATLVASYTVNSTGGKLPDDNVLSIAFDGPRGIAYFGTEKGLASIRTSFVAPRTSFAGLSFYPNPFIVGGGKRITIDGLVQGSSVKILSSDGRLIRELSDQQSLPGGRIAYWDGTDQNGAAVASGIYLVVAYTQQGDQVATGKVAVVKK